MIIQNRIMKKLGFVRNISVILSNKYSRCCSKHIGNESISIENQNKIDEGAAKHHVLQLLKRTSFMFESINITPASISGENYIRWIAKVKVHAQDYQGNVKEFKWIVKCAQDYETFRKLTNLAGVFHREIHMYRNVFSAMENVQINVGIRRPFRPYPKCYYHFSEAPNEALILEDMKEKRNHALFIIQNYAKFHALSHVLKDQKPKLFSEFFNQDQTHYINLFTEDRFVWFSKNQKRKFLEVLDHVADEEIIIKLNNYSKSSTFIKNALKRDEFNVFIRDDCWINNMLFLFEDYIIPNISTSVCFLDYQLSCLASPVFVISHFICVNIDGPLINQNFDLLLKSYSECLALTITKLEGNPDKLYAPEVFQQHIKQSMVYGPSLSGTMVKLMITDFEDVVDITETKTREEFKEMYKYQPKNMEEYRIRVRNIFLDFDKHGFLLNDSYA